MCFWLGLLGGGETVTSLGSAGFRGWNNSLPSVSNVFGWGIGDASVASVERRPGEEKCSRGLPSACGSLSPVTTASGNKSSARPSPDGATKGPAALINGKQASPRAL